MTVTGPDFIALQVRDLERAAAFYEEPPRPAPRAVQPAPRGRVRHDARALRGAGPAARRRPRLRRAAGPRRGAVAAQHRRAGAARLARRRRRADPTPPFDGPFGRTFAFADPDGYVVTIHG